MEIKITLDGIERTVTKDQLFALTTQGTIPVGADRFD